jgi:NHLM bacteriocin system ABC transporter ATP-binding protein
MKKLLPCLQAEALKRTLSVNTPFLLNEADKFYILATGQIHIYTVRLQDSEPVGQRFYFASAEAGKLLLPIADENAQYGFWADALEESILYEFTQTQFEAWLQQSDLKDTLTQLFDEAIESITEALAENSNHPNQTAQVLVEGNEKLILRQGELLSVQRGVAWAKVSASKLNHLRYNVYTNFPYIDEDEKGDTLIPLTRHTFLASERNVGIKFLRSAEAFQTTLALQGWKLLYAPIITLERNEIALKEILDQQRFEQKYTHQVAQVQAVLQEAQDILTDSKSNKYAQWTEATDNRLFQACQIVASAQNISLTLPTDTNETDPLTSIMQASQARYREVLIQGAWYKKDTGALLGFEANTGEPIALMPAGRQGYEAYKPKTKETWIVTPKNASRIDKLAYTLYASLPHRALTLWDLVDFGLLADQKAIFLLFVMAGGATFLGMLLPIITEVLFDFVIPNARYLDVLHVGLGLFMATLGYLLFKLTEGYALLRIETKWDSRLQAAVWDRLLNLPATFFKQFTTGDLADRTMGLNHIRQMLSESVIMGLLGSIFAVLNIGLLFYYSVPLALLVLGLVAVEVSIMFVLGRWQIAYEKVARGHEGKVQGIILQLLHGVGKFRVTGTEVRAYTHWLKHFTAMKQANFRTLQIQNQQMNLNAVVPILGAMVLYFGMSYLGEARKMSTGVFLAFYAAYGAFIGAVLNGSHALLTIYSILPIYERTKPILTALPETHQAKLNVGKLKGNIEVSQVNFRYQSDAPLVLQDLNLSLKAGEYVAFVGASGSGKSSLIRLLLGFEKAESGTIYFDNQDLSQLDIKAIRRQIGVVLQDGQLVPGDILSNIIGTSPHLTVDDAWEACRLAALEEDIKRMPMGMHTVINEGATTLSGGQRQRLLIAQVLVHKPRILIFDEATSALDNRTQATVTQSLNKLQATRIVIAHRLSTIQDVDKIIVFDKGRIVQQGTFAELMAVEGVFKLLAMRQI